ncbi:MAG: alanine dehydrogenase [Nitrospirota bacterium]|nr:alanine dehydrogenase [Nitrospirota bacterium]
MIIGVPKEIKTEEYRVGMTPDAAREVKRFGTTILVETGAGRGSGFSDDEYLDADADIVDRKTLFNRAELIIKVKEPLPAEYALLRDGQALFTYLHLAPNRELTDILLAKKIIGLAYETLSKDGTLPLLAPMSEIAGRMAPLAAAFHLQKHRGGSGILPTGTAGVKPARMLVLGAGVVGTNAARVAAGIGMEVLVMNKTTDRLKVIDDMFQGRIETLPLSPRTLEQEIRTADIVVGSILIPGGRTPVFITRKILGTMKQGSVIVDVSVDQGGCCETSRPTTHADPTFEVDGIVHYCVANMPGAYPRTSTLALTNATLPYIKLLATRGIEKVIQESTEIKSALNTYRGEIVNKSVATAFSRI